MKDGIEDLAHNAAVYSVGNGHTVFATMSVGDAIFQCFMGPGQTTWPGSQYCDASNPWSVLPAKAVSVDAVTLLKHDLPTFPSAAVAPYTGTVLHSLGTATIRGVAVTGFYWEVDKPSTISPSAMDRGRVEFWVDSHQFVREYQLTERLNGQMSDDASDYVAWVSTLSVNPSFAAVKQQLEDSVPGGLASPTSSVPGVVTMTTTVQLWGFGTTPAIVIPTGAAVESPSYPEPSS
jgi:hypothetical protein